MTGCNLEGLNFDINFCVDTELIFLPRLGEPRIKMNSQLPPRRRWGRLVYAPPTWAHPLKLWDAWWSRIVLASLLVALHVRHLHESRSCGQTQLPFWWTLVLLFEAHQWRSHTYLQRRLGCEGISPCGLDWWWSLAWRMLEPAVLKERKRERERERE